MSTAARTCALLISSLVVVAAAVFGASEIQRHAAAVGIERTEAIDGAQAHLEASLDNYLEFGGQELLYALTHAQAALDQALTRAHQAAGDDERLQLALEGQEAVADRWGAWAQREIFERQELGRDEFGPAHARTGSRIVDSSPPRRTRSTTSWPPTATRCSTTRGGCRFGSSALRSPCSRSPAIS